MTHVEKTNQVSDEDREAIQDQLASFASNLRSRYKMTVEEVKKFLREVLSTVV